MNYETLAIHAAQEIDPQTGAVMVPIYQTSTLPPGMLILPSIRDLKLSLTYFSLCLIFTRHHARNACFPAATFVLLFPTKILSPKIITGRFKKVYSSNIYFL